MNEKLQPALWGGLLIGILSGLPLIGAGNCCCCLWVLAGGALAAYLHQQNRPYQITSGDAALVGLMAGLIGAVVDSLISIPFRMMAGQIPLEALDRIFASNPDIPPEAREIAQRFVAGSGLWIVKLMIDACIFAVFGTLGGLLGIAIFKKDLPPPPPPGTIDVPPTPYVPPISAPPASEPPPPPPPPPTSV